MWFWKRHISVCRKFLQKGVAVAYEFEKIGAAIIVDKNVKELSGAILKVLENPKLSREIGLNGKNSLSLNFHGIKLQKNLKMNMMRL